MSVLSVQNIQETFVGGNVGRTATQVTDPSASGYITDGEVVVVNSSGVVYDASTMTYASSPWIQIVQRNGDNLVWSSKIYGDKVVGYRGRAGAQGQEQIYHIGYIGSGTNVLDVTAGLDYQLTVIENQDDMMWSEQKKKNVVNVPNNLVVTQMDLAKAIVKNQMKKYNTDGSSITAVMLNSGSAGDVDGTSRTLAVTHGSNVIVYSGATANISGAGAIVRIGTTTVASGRGTGIPVYTIQGAHPTIANAFILDQPYAGPTQTAIANANHGVVATAGPYWGVRFTGKNLPYRRDFFKFKRVGFTLQMSGFGATPLTKTQEASYGYGDGRLVLEEESFTKGFEGALNRMTVPLPLANETFTASAATTLTQNATYGDAFVTATALYDSITIEFYSQDSATITAVPAMPQLIKIFAYDGAGQNTTANTGIQPALNDWMNGTPRAFANLSVM